MKIKTIQPINWIFPSILIFSLLFIGACAPQARKAVSALDTPEHHVFSGMKLLEKENYDDAIREFNLAIQLDPKFSSAYTGIGLVNGYKGNFKEAFDNAKKGRELAKTNDDKVNARVGLMRIYSMERKDGWIDEVESTFKDAIDIDPKSSAAHYYMGEAYKLSYNFDKSGEMFKKVLDINDKYLIEADNQWKLVQKIQRAAPGSMIGKKIALIEKITRADIAALFVQELKLEKLYEKRSPKKFDTSYKAPSKAFEADRIEKTEAATDISNHVLRTDIQTVLNIGVKGLEPYPDHTYRPDDVITRASYAIMVEDILIKVTGDDKLATKYIGNKSPFPDLRSDLPYFNAVMVATTRGIMEAVDLTTGEFAPMKPVSGADALLIIRKLKDELRFF
ncbi:MAG: S-layer homology domain-containing protein [Thermodesulfobacteriota bacterium]